MLGVTEVQEKVVGSVRNIWLAGLGAAVLAQEEGTKMFDTLVQKGEEAKKDATEKATSTWDKVSHSFDEQVAQSLHRIGVPTREEIATLTRRVDALIASVDKLRAKTPLTEVVETPVNVKA
jgi:polyhydroxyalkanoate synthesis regulator phasin